MNEKTKTRLIVALAVAFLLLLFFRTCNTKKVVEPANVPTLKEVVKQAKIDSTFFFKKMDSLKVVADKWKDLATTNKGKLKVAEGMVNEILNNLPEPIHDTVKVAQTDIDYFKTVIASKDSACNNAIDAQDSVILTQIIQLEESTMYNERLKISYLDATKIAEVNTATSKQFEKKYKRQKRTTGLYKVVAIAAIGYGVFKSL